MSIAPDFEATLLEAGYVLPPNDLLSDEPPLESELHFRQIMLLIQSLELHWIDRQDFYAFGNLTIYYSPNQRKNRDFRGPDFFVVLGTDRRPRKSWMVWEEDGKYPNVIIQLLSDSTATVDRTTKKQLYQDTFRTPEYFWFDPNGDEFQGFELLNGQYQELQPNAQGWFWSRQLGLYLGVADQKLRFFTPAGELVSTPQENAIAQQQQAEKLAAKLRELGIDPTTL